MSRIAFIFPGQGAQTCGIFMSRQRLEERYLTEPQIF